ncbi:MFS transporter [Ramlibacter sp. AN1133]|uniref:MFS transporter n=1 Tax=Ramlibacter sp. AN1133 TaxID=3133429 RepID=UPI0030BC3AD8
MRSEIGTRWYFGWNIVAAAAVLTLLSTGMRLGMGPYFMPMARELGFSRTLLSTIMAGGMLCYGIALPLAGFLVSRYGTRRVLLAGAGAVLLAAVIAANTQDAPVFLFAFGGLLSIGLAFTSPVALTPVISHWFTRRRGMALFFLATGAMAGMAVVTPVTTFAVAWFGWRATLVGFAALLAACTVPAALFIVRDLAPVNTDLLPEEAQAQRAQAATLPQPLEPSEAVRTGTFWKIVFGLFCCGFSMNLLGTHGMPMLMDHGFDAVTAAMTVGLVGVAAIGGSVLLGGMADRMPRRNLLATVYLVRGLGFFALVLASSGLELYFTATMMGLVWAGGAALSAAILADVYGLRLVGLLYGIAYFGHQVGAALSSFLGGWAYEAFGTHWVAFGACGMLLLAGGVVSLQLPRRATLLMPPVPAPAR